MGGASPPPPAVYANAPYGFRLALAPGMHACRAPAPGPDHGASVRPAGAACGGDYVGPQVLVNAEFNAVEASSTAALASTVCADGTFTKARLGSLRALGCRLKAQPGYQCIVAQRRTGRDPDGWINYQVCATGYAGEGANRAQATNFARKVRLTARG